jgi:Tfp pilus assembly protein PilN
VSQVNLLPPEIRQRQRLQRLTSIVIGGGFVLILLVLGLYAVQVGRLSSVNADIERQNANNDAITKQIQPLQQWAQLRTRAQQKQSLLDSAYSGEVSASSMLQDVSLAIPSDAYLTSLSIQISTPQVGVGAEPSPFVGSVTASGRAASIQTLSSWLTRLEGVNGWDNPWVTTISKDASTGQYLFETGIDLSVDVLTSRGRKGTP